MTTRRLSNVDFGQQPRPVRKQSVLFAIPLRFINEICNAAMKLVEEWLSLALVKTVILPIHGGGTSLSVQQVHRIAGPTMSDITDEALGNRNFLSGPNSSSEFEEYIFIRICTKNWIYGWKKFPMLHYPNWQIRLEVLKATYLLTFLKFPWPSVCRDGTNYLEEIQNLSALTKLCWWEKNGA